MKRKLPKFDEGNRHASPGSTESPNNKDAKRTTLRHIIIKMLKVKDKKRIFSLFKILKGSERKDISYLQGSSHCFLK